MNIRNWTLALAIAAAGAALGAQAPDRSKPPALGPAPAVKLPTIQKLKLSNGLPVWIVEMHKVPVVQVNAQVWVAALQVPLWPAPSIAMQSLFVQQPDVRTQVASLHAL